MPTLMACVTTKPAGCPVRVGVFTTVVKDLVAREASFDALSTVTAFRGSPVSFRLLSAVQYRFAAAA